MQSHDFVVHYNCDKAKRSEAATLGDKIWCKGRFGLAYEAAGSCRGNVRRNLPSSSD
jgi:hypothetical protein